MSTLAIQPEVRALFLEAAATLRPPPKVTITEWAERHIVLSTEDSAEGGTQYRSARAPYQRGMQDAILDPSCEEVVLMTSAQIGKTLIEKNTLGYFIVEDPSPIVWLVPTLELAKKVSMQRIAPMIRDNPCLSRLFDLGAKKAGTGKLERHFPGGVLFMIGANSPASLSSMPVRIVIVDEEDRIEDSAGVEGDPIALIGKRQLTYWNRKRLRASTPTIRGDSRIEAAYENTDKAKYYVPCLHCGEMQVLKWSHLVFVKDQPLTVDNVHYACETCGAAHSEFDKLRMLQLGEWRSEHPEIRKRRGFWINELYSTFVTWAEMATAFLEAHNKRFENPQLMKVWVNTALAETWVERDEEKLDKNSLVKRCEAYPPPALPDGIVVLTAGVDVQDDRIEVEVVGWGRGYPSPESWSVDCQKFEGNPTKPEVWAKLDEYLEREWLHARGVRLPIAATFIDSGYNANHVYAFTKTRSDRRIFASKGMNTWNAPPLARNPSKNNKGKVDLQLVGVSQIKKQIYKWLRIDTPGPGYMHFSSLHNDADYFNQLTVEKLVKGYKNGFPVFHWEKPAGARNEAIDRRVYAYAAFLSLAKDPAAMMAHLEKKLMEEARSLAELRRRHQHPDQLALLTVQDEAVVDPWSEVGAKVEGDGSQRPTGTELSADAASSALGKKAEAADSANTPEVPHEHGGNSEAVEESVQKRELACDSPEHKTEIFSPPRRGGWMRI